MKYFIKTLLAKLVEESGYNPQDYLNLDNANLLLKQVRVDDIDEISQQLMLLCNNSKIIFQKQFFTSDEFYQFAQLSTHPFLVFEKTNAGSNIPILINKVDQSKEFKLFVFQDDYSEISEPVKTESLSEYNFALNNEGKIICINIFPLNIKSSFNNEHDNNDLNKNRFKIIGEFLGLLAEERKEIIYVWTYALLSGIITLSLPLGIQSLITFVSSGQAVTSVYILILFIVIGIFGAGFITILQIQLVEYIRQRLFVKNTFHYAYVIPKIKLESILKYNPPELVNRFFDVVSVQKGIATLLIDFSSASLQILFGIILLALYHPVFIVIGVFLVLMLLLIIMLTGPKALETSINESTYKYKIANWLEEMARALSTFKLAGNTSFAQDKTDTLLTKYLFWRNKHFKILVTQYYSFVIFKTLITATLLMLGVYLIINQLITLGQFIAAEIIIILIMNSIEKIIIKLDTVYDVLTSTEKLSKVKQLPTDNYSGIEFTKTQAESGIELDVVGLSYHYSDSEETVLNDINLKIKAAERICICGDNGSGKTTLVNVILGIYDNYSGAILYNGMSLRIINKLSLFDYLGDYISQQGIFDGTLIENLLIGRKNISFDDVKWATQIVGLNDWINNLPDGFDTQIVGGAVRLSSGIEKRIVLARNMVDKPKVLVLDDFLLGVSKTDKVRIMQTLTSSEYPWSLILISNDPAVMKYCQRIVMLHKGSLVADSDFKTLEESNKQFRELIYNI